MSYADLQPIKLALPTNADDRAIDWATRNHRISIRHSAVGSRSKHGNAARQTFVNGNAEVDVMLDTSPMSVSARKAHRNRKSYRPLRERLLAN